MRNLLLVSLVLLILSAILLPMQASAGIVGYFNVRGSIPTSSQIGAPSRWSASVPDDLANKPCVVYLWTYGGTDAYYEFPSSLRLTGIGNAADWCRGLAPGQTVCVDGHELYPPDAFGQTFIAEHARLCQ